MRDGHQLVVQYQQVPYIPLKRIERLRQLQKIAQRGLLLA